MATADTFVASLENALALIDQLASLIEQEKSTLGQAEPERLKTLVQQKLELLSALERNTKSRLVSLKQLGFTPDERGFRGYLETLDQLIAVPLQELWAQVAFRLDECKTANTINGKVIQRSRQQVQSMLALLRGNDGVGNVYNEAGNTHSLAGNYAIAKA